MLLGYFCGRYNAISNNNTGTTTMLHIESRFTRSTVAHAIALANQFAAEDEDYSGQGDYEMFHHHAERLTIEQLEQWQNRADDAMREQIKRAEIFAIVDQYGSPSGHLLVWSDAGTFMYCVVTG